MQNFHNIYILGAHKLSCSYFTKIQKAKRDGDLDFSNLYLIDDNPETEAHKHKDMASNIIQKSYTDFVLSHCHSKNFHESDLLIPDHTAKHVLYGVYLDAAQKTWPQKTISPQKITADFNTPFLYKSDDESVWAVSHATWTCAADCDEPKTCPHTQNLRDWDLHESLQTLCEEFTAQKTLCFRYFCQAFVQEVSYIPFVKIKKDIKSFTTLETTQNPQNVLVATHSHCHGILGQFCVS